MRRAWRGQKMGHLALVENTILQFYAIHIRGWFKWSDKVTSILNFQLHPSGLCLCQRLLWTDPCPSPPDNDQPNERNKDDTSCDNANYPTQADIISTTTGCVGGCVDGSDRRCRRCWWQRWRQCQRAVVKCHRHRWCQRPGRGYGHSGTWRVRQTSEHYTGHYRGVWDGKGWNNGAHHFWQEP